MRRVFGALCALAIALFGCAVLASCSIREIARVEVKSGSFKEDYAVDERLDLSTAALAVFYDKGDEAIAIDADMITGFDTVTTGNKTLTVTYKGFSVDVPYRVYNPENAAKSIETSARLALFADGGEGYMEYSVHYRAGDLTSVQAASFTIKSDYPLGADASLDALTVSSDFKSASYKCSLAEDGTALRVIIFTGGDVTFPTGGVIAKFRIAGGNNRSVSLGDAVLSDGTSDYYLPPAA